MIYSINTTIHKLKCSEIKSYFIYEKFFIYFYDIFYSCNSPFLT